MKEGGGSIPSPEPSVFLMYRMELKEGFHDRQAFRGHVPNVPYGVESPETGKPEETKIWFLMYRMELKEGRECPSGPLWACS